MTVRITTVPADHVDVGERQLGDERFELGVEQQEAGAAVLKDVANLGAR